jgi:hypothetical protein
VSADQVAEILLVRAAEEAGAAELGPEAQIDALEAAGDLDDERTWFARRAAWLLDHELGAYRRVLGVREAFTPGPAAVFALPFLLGLASNYLGPRAQIHVLYNPIVFLVLWSLAVYAALALRALLRGRRPRAPHEAPRAAPSPRTTPPRAPAPRTAPARLPPTSSAGWLGLLLRRSAGALWLRLHRGAAGARDRTLTWATVGSRFAELWDEAARAWFVLRTRRVLHAGAAALAVGAIAGMYVRGLFFEYEMVWRSTFLRDPASVARLLGILLAPACRVLGQPLPGAADASALLGPEGVPAAPWIHLHAVTAALFVVAPRLLLAAWTGARLRRVSRRLDLGLDQPYYTSILKHAREIQVVRVKEEIGSAVRAECERFADGLAAFVTESLYDARIAPRLAGFRESGGRIADLETAVRSECERFEDDLTRHMEHAQREFEADLAAEVWQRIGRRLVVPHASTKRLGAAVALIPGHSVGNVGDALSGRLARDFAAAVTVAAGAVVGTVSGGFGSHVGAAILVALLHTTGPVGFLIGAVGGAVAAAAALWAGRERVREAIRSLPLPGAAVRLALPGGRFERIVAEGRERCRRAVRELVGTKLEPLTDELADQVWARVKPLLAQATEATAAAPATTGSAAPAAPSRPVREREQVHDAAAALQREAPDTAAREAQVPAQAE